MLRFLKGIASAVGIGSRAFVALVGVAGITAAVANYAMTQGSGTNFGSIVVSSVHYAQQLICDVTTPSQCGAVKAGNTAATTDVAQVVSDPNVLAAVASPMPLNVNTVTSAWTGLTPGTPQSTTIIAANMDLSSVAGIALGAMANYGTSPGAVKVQGVNAFVTNPVVAGENHIGEIGSNQIKVQVAQTVTASAYSAGNALGGLMTVANAARVSGSAGAAGTGGILTGMQLNSKATQTGVQTDVFIFDANPTGSTCTDKTAFVIANADFDKVVGILTIPATASNGAGWFSATTTGAVAMPTYYPITYDLASSTSIYACAVVRAAITPGSTSDISFKFNMLRN